MKKKLLILLSLLFFTPFVIKAEELKMDWQNSIGGNYSEGFSELLQTKDGGFIAYGFSRSTDIEGLPNKGGSDVIIVKYDKDGNLIGQKSWGGNDEEEFSELLQTEDGSFIAYGYSQSTDIEGLPNKGGRDAIIVKYDNDGNLMWQKSWGGNNWDVFHELLQTEDGGFIAHGYSNSTDIEGLPNKSAADVIIVKYDKNGNLMWQKSWGGDRFEGFSELLQTKDGGFIAYGYSLSTDIEGLPNKGDIDTIIVKYDKDGNLMWQNSWGGNAGEEFYELLQTEDGGFIAYGYSHSTDIEGLPNKGESDVIIVKYDKDGNLMWQKSWGGNKGEAFYELLQVEDGGFIAYGYSHSTDIEGLPNKGEGDAIIAKYDKDGNLLWQKNWGGNKTEEFYDLLQTKDGAFIAHGYSYSTDIEGLPNKGAADVIIVKYDKNGNLMWQKSWGGDRFEGFSELLQTKDGGFIAYGYSLSTDIEGLPNKNESNFTTDVIIVKYDKDGNLVWQKSWGGNEDEEFSELLQTKDGGFIAYGYSLSTDIEGFPNKENEDAIIVKYSIEYDLEIITTENGTSTAIQQGKYGVITPTPNEGYEVDKIIIKDKDGNVLDVEVTNQEDGLYSFELYTDVSVEVLFKGKIENPKTGIVDIITIIFIGFAISIFGFFIVKRYNERLEF